MAGGNLSELQIGCLISVGYAAFLRCHNLSISRAYMFITLTKRTNDQFREGSTVLVARTGSHTCPVSLTERFLLVRKHQEAAYLFRTICHTKHGLSFHPQQLSYSRATDVVNKQLKAIGYDPSQCSLHSLNSGGASSAAVAAIPDRLLIRHGGWHPQTANNMYIKKTEQALLEVSRALRL